jgi:hypothetical protein
MGADWGQTYGNKTAHRLWGEDSVLFLVTQADEALDVDILLNEIAEFFPQPMHIHFKNPSVSPFIYLRPGPPVISISEHQGSVENTKWLMGVHGM